MKLSEAIRLGAMLKPQAYTSRAQDGACALRAAADAAGIKDRDGVLGAVLNYSELRRRFPVLDMLVEASNTGCIHPLYREIYYRNDISRNTREQIADYVESIERAHEPQAEPVAVAVRQ
jgi:hypothetical protein